MDASPNHDHPQVSADRAFAALIREARTKPFEWGSHDCVLFAASVVKLVRGRDALAELGVEPTWRTAAQAYVAIQGFGGLRTGLTRLFGEPIGVLQAHTGDVALVRDPEHEERELLAVIHHGVLLAPSALGLALLSLDSAIAAWRTAP